MDDGAELSAEEKSRVEALLRKCFPAVENLEKSLKYTLCIQSDNKSFWSKIIRVHLSWNDNHLSLMYPEHLFMKIPNVSQNVKNVDENVDDAAANEASLSDTLLKLTKSEVLWYEYYGGEVIPYFPTPRFYAAEEISEAGTGIIALEDLTGHVNSMDFLPGFSYKQVARLMDALAGFHYHFISKEDQSWVSMFDRVEEIDQEFQDLQFETALRLETMHPEKFLGRVRTLRTIYSADSAIKAHYSYKELGVPPVLVHFDLNPTNVLWKATSTETNELAAIIDFQSLHTGNFAEDIVRILMCSLSRHNRRKLKDVLLERYYNTLTELFKGAPPFSLKKVHEAYDRIFLFASNFAVFSLVIYHDLYNTLQQDPERRAAFQDELIDRVYGIISEIECLLRVPST